MTEKTKAGTARRPYEPPQLEQVQLVVEEVLIQGCKTNTLEGNPGVTPCVPGAGTAPCRGAGS